MTKESDAYILGTDFDELQRLGLQHQVWASEAQLGWKKAGFTQGMTLLDLGCGPGFCTKELAYIAGSKGNVVGVDLSQGYIDYLDTVKELHQLNITTMCTDFDNMELAPNSIDGMYCRWALAWIPNPKEILEKVLKALKPGGKMVIQEYYDWSTHQTKPNLPGLDKAIKACLKSFEEYKGDINIGNQVGGILSELGMEVTSQRPLAKMATPNDMTWNWPRSFYMTYFPRLVEMGYLTEEQKEQAYQDMSTLEKNPLTTLFCPFMIEVIAEKK